MLHALFFKPLFCLSASKFLVTFPIRVKFKNSQYFNMSPKRKSPEPDPQATDLGAVAKSPLNDKDYKAIVLPNGLRALLISSCTHELEVDTLDEITGKYRSEKLVIILLNKSIWQSSSQLILNLISSLEIFKNFLQCI